MIHSRKLRYLILIIVSTIGSVSLIFTLTSEKMHGYEIIFLHPLLYLVTYLLLIDKTIKYYGMNIFLAIYIVVSSTRYLVLPILVLMSDWYFGRGIIHPTNESNTNAIILMSYELIVYSFSIYFFHKLLIKKQEGFSNEIIFINKNTIYLSFFIFSLFLILLFPSALNFFSFVTINDSLMTISEASTLEALIAMLLNIAKYLFTVFIISKLYYIFKNTSEPLFIILTLGVILINTVIFFGTNRSDFIFNVIANVVLLLYIFKKYGVYLSLILGALAPAIIALISSHRQSATITGGNNALVDFTDTLQIYLAGVYNVAMSIEMKTMEAVNPLYSFFDIMRSAIGPNIILKNYDIITATIVFNSRIYHNDHVAQIVPMIGQGYYYFGFLFSPIIGVIFIFIAIWLISIMIKSKRIEVIYFFSIFSGRYGFVMAQNGNILINDISFMFPIFIILYFLNKKFG